MRNTVIRIFNIERVERAVKTFVETFFSYIAVNVLITDITKKSALYALLAGAIASAISVVLNIKNDKMGSIYDEARKITNIDVN